MGALKTQLDDCPWGLGSDIPAFNKSDAYCPFRADVICGEWMGFSH